MLKLFKIPGFLAYSLIILLNAMTDLGHKIILQNTIFKAYSGSEQIILTALVNALILLPFIFLFSPAGHISDKYPKTKVIEYAAAFAIVITALITLSYYNGWFWFAFFLTLILAAQSAIYSPAKYGLIKEMTGNEKLAEANAFVQAVTIIAILAGAVIYSFFFENLLANSSNIKSEILQAIAPLGFLLVIASLFEYMLAKNLAKNFKKVEINESMTFDAKEYAKLNYLRDNFKLLRKHKAVWLSIIGLSVFWGISQVVVAIFGEYLKDELSITNTVIAQGLLSLSGLGIIFGSLYAGKVSKNYIEIGIVPLGVLGMALALYFIPHLQNLNLLAADIFAFGFFAGLFIVPLNALIQFLTPSKVLGKVLAGNNFMQNVFMFAFLIVTAIFAYFNLNAKSLFYLSAAIAFLGFLYTLIELPQSLVRYFLKSFISLKYNLKVYGLDNIKADKGILLLGNHISFLDWAILQMAYPRQIRFVIDREYYNRWYLKPFLKFFKVIPISSRGSKSAIKTIGEALKNGDTVALFPEGHISRNGHLSTFKRGFENAVKELSNEDATIVPFYLRGLWEDNFSYASKKLKNSKTKDISVTFGKNMDIHSSANEVKRAVFDLSIKAWLELANTLKPIQKAWLDSAKEYPLRVAVADSTGVELSSDKFITAVFLMAKKLKPLLKEKNIGLIVPSSAGGAIANMATLCLGKTIVNLNYSSGDESLQHAIEIADIKRIITSRLFISKLKAKGFDLDNILQKVEVIYLEDIKKSIGKLESLLTFFGVKLLPHFILQSFVKDAKIDDTAAILFSSGSEGRPKGIELSHKNIMGNIKQIATLINARDEDVMLGTLPIFHSFGLTVTTLFPLIEAVPVAFHPDPTDGYGVGKLAHKYQATMLFGTATFFRLYTRNKKIHPLMFKHLRLVIAGAEKLPQEVAQNFKKRFNKDIFEGYGATETTPVASVNIEDILMEDLTLQIGNKPGTVGQPLPGTSFKIVDPESFKELPIGEDGMILIGGTQIMKGYIKEPQKTASVIKEIDGIRWYVTGDKGHLDEDGFLTIVDRYSRFAKLGGEMVSLGLVEAQIRKVLNEDSEILATSVPDSKKGEKIILLVEGDIEIDELKEKIKSLNLNPLYLPSLYFKLDELPKLGSGKADFKKAKKVALELTK